MELHLEKLIIPEGANLILGQSHFIKTVEDLYEIMVAAAAGIKFGLAFSEATTPTLPRRPRTTPSASPPATPSISS
jgi:adenosine/AMP kinase